MGHSFRPLKYNWLIMLTMALVHLLPSARSFAADLSPGVYMLQCKEGEVPVMYNLIGQEVARGKTFICPYSWTWKIVWKGIGLPPDPDVDRWTVSSTAGVNFSGLFNESYGLQEGDSSSTGRVVTSHRDSSVSIEPTLGLAFSRASWRGAVLTGLGISDDGELRLSVGYGWRMTDTSLLSVGIAAGQVRRLGVELSEANSPNFNGEFSTEREIEAAFFVGIAYRFPHFWRVPEP